MKRFLLTDARVCQRDDSLVAVDLYVEDGMIRKIGQSLADTIPADVPRIHAGGRLLAPGFIDLHVHLRDPGLTYKETLTTGTQAAALGGYTQVLAMPNTKPVPDTPEQLRTLVSRAAEEGVVRVGFYSSITQGERGECFVPFEEQAEAGCVAFSDDGRGVQATDKTYEAMQALAKLGPRGILAEHCEEESLLAGGYIHAGKYAREHGHRGILHAVEDLMIARDLLLAAETSCRYHICHMSTSRGCDLLRLAQSWGADVSGEVTPHHLLLTDADLEEDGKWKMNPPLREEKDRQALLQALREGVICAIATDHAPHGEEEKARGLEKAPFGITGLETAFPLLYTKLVRKGELSLHRLLEALTASPASRFGLAGGKLEEGEVADLVLIDLDEQWTIDPALHASKGKNTPFGGWKVQSRITDVWCAGTQVVKDAQLTGRRYAEDE